MVPLQTGYWFGSIFMEALPIHKGGDKGDPGNFRPMSVVPIMAKILEKLIANHLSSYLECHNFLREHQGGYCHGRSSEQIYSAVDTNSPCYGSTSGGVCCSPLI